MFGDPTYADAVLDRLVHNAHRIDLNGESLRRTRKPGRKGRKAWPLRLDNAEGVAHISTAGAAKNKSFEPRFKI